MKKRTWEYVKHFCNALKYIVADWIDELLPLLRVVVPVVMLNVLAVQARPLFIPYLDIYVYQQYLYLGNLPTR